MKTIEQSAAKRRNDRRSVYAVAVAERLGLDDATLARVRQAAQGEPNNEPAVRSILDLIERFDGLAWPTIGEPIDPEAALEAIRREGIGPDLGLAFEALRQVSPLIQPIEDGFAEFHSRRR